MRWGDLISLQISEGSYKEGGDGLFQSLTMLIVRKFFLISNLNLGPLLLVLSLKATEERLSRKVVESPPWKFSRAGRKALD